jgi:uncharacterized membrane protein YsdA (DUF1294 family)
MLAVAALGGLGGAFVGRLYFRQRLRSRTFNRALYSILVVECLGVAVLLLVR